MPPPMASVWARRPALALCVAALCVAALCVAAARAQTADPETALQGDASRCLARFAQRPTAFANCTTTVCFLFLQEEPYVILDPSMKSVADQRLFPCRAPQTLFPRLRGTVFAIHNATSLRDDALCVWAGSGCSFDDLTSFLSVTSVSNSSYRFAATGLLLEAPARVTATLYPSSSILDSQLVIIGPRDASDGSSSPLYILMRPFRRGAWVLFWGMIAVFVLFGLLIVFVFTPGPFRWHALFFHFMGEPVDDHSVHAKRDSAPTSPGDASAAGDAGEHSASVSHLGCSWDSTNTAMRQRRDSVRDNACSQSWGDTVADGDEYDPQSRLVSYRSALWLFRVALSSFLIMFILFYEIAVVNFMFIQNTKPLAKNIARLSAGELSQYAILKASGLEDVWIKTVDSLGIYNSSNYPWYRCESSDDCFEKVLDKNHVAKHVVTFDNFGHYQMLKRGVCNKLTIYKTERRLYSFGAGWLYGEGVPADTRRQIDKDILDLRVTDEMRQIMKNHMGKQNTMTCQSTPSDIDASIVGLAILILVGPSLAMLTIILCVAAYKGTTSANHEAHNDWAEFVRRTSGRSGNRRRNFT